MTTKTISTEWADYEVEQISLVNPKNGKSYPKFKIRRPVKGIGKYYVGIVNKESDVERAIELYEKWGIETG